MRSYSDRPEDGIKVRLSERRVARRQADPFRPQSLQDAFRNPGSPFYLAPGERGPAEPFNWPEHDPAAPYLDPETGHAGSDSSKAAAGSSSSSAEPGSASSSAISHRAAHEQIPEAAKTHLGWPHNRPNYEGGRLQAEAHATEKGFDLESMIEWPVSWGEQDQFR